MKYLLAILVLSSGLNTFACACDEKEGAKGDKKAMTCNHKGKSCHCADCKCGEKDGKSCNEDTKKQKS